MFWRLFRRPVQSSNNNLPPPIAIGCAQPGHVAVYNSASVVPRTAINTVFFDNTSSKWTVLGASVPGLAKFRSGKECEDYCNFFAIYPGCGLLVIADGAGSCSHAAIGSRHVAEVTLARALRRSIDRRLGIFKRLSPATFLSSISEDDWRTLAKTAFIETKASLADLARKLRLSLDDLSCTAIACILLGNRILVAHVGDGRGTFQDSASEEWKPLFDPVAGERAGETVFLTSPIFEEPDLSDLFRTHVYDVAAKAVAIMSDGCENGSFTLTTVDPTSGKHVRANIPFVGFFNAVPAFVGEIVAIETSPALTWAHFLTDGTRKFAEEGDDKSMLVAVRLPHVG